MRGSSRPPTPACAKPSSMAASAPTCFSASRLFRNPFGSHRTSREGRRAGENFECPRRGGGEPRSRRREARDLGADTFRETARARIGDLTPAWRDDEKLLRCCHPDLLVCHPEPFACHSDPAVAGEESLSLRAQGELREGSPQLAQDKLREGSAPGQINDKADPSLRSG